MTIKLKNNARSTLATALSASATQATLAAGGGSEFPALGVGEHFYATLVATDGTLEIVDVTAVSGDVLTITRGAEGTTPAAFPSGSLVEQRITVATLTEAITDNAGGVTSVAASGGTTGLTFTGTPITSTGTLTLGGTLAITSGGTGASSLQTARANLLPSYSGSAGKALVVNVGETDIEWQTLSGTGTVTSVALSAGTTGLTVSGSPITTSGTITLGGTLAVSNGGTGAITHTANRLLRGDNTSPLVASGIADFSTTENIRITAGGDVGLGTTTPGAKLDVRGLIRSATGSARVDLNHDGTNASVNSTSALLLYAGGANSLIMHTNGAARLTINSLGGITSSDLADAVGYKGLPQNSQTTGYTLVLADAGKHISITTGGVTIPANSVTAFPVGTTIVVYNNSASGQTISISSDTLRQAGTANTGNRTLAQRGVATLLKVASTEWVVTGNVT